MPNDTQNHDWTQGQKSVEEQLVQMLKELEQNVMELSQRVDVLEQQGNAPLNP